VNIYRHKTLWKLALILFAVIIGLLSLFYTQSLVKKLKEEERKKVELWAEATRQFINSPDSTQNLVFLAKIIEENNTVPVIWTDATDNIISVKNFDSVKVRDTKYLLSRLNRMKEKTEPIIIDLGGGDIQKIYYRDSIILTRLTWYPYVQLSVIVLFILVSYLAFSSSRKAEQNQVWVGMSKETAHQLGTPTSSLAAWVEILQLKHPEVTIAEEMGRDVSRLEKVTERFSKIGSRPDLTSENIIVIVHQAVEYLKSRSSSKVTFTVTPPPETSIFIAVNVALFSWVIENVCKNAIDATEGDGKIEIQVSETDEGAIIDITDNGKGIPKSAHKKIFRPGYTTKKMGWGLGLSLSKRIIEEYHNGKIFVKQSEPNMGTCIRIVMKKGSR
jgi:two-component system, sporulation sensor kinase D